MAGRAYAVFIILTTLGPILGNTLLFVLFKEALQGSVGLIFRLRVPSLVANHRTVLSVRLLRILMLLVVAEARFELAIALWAIPAYETGELGHYSTLRYGTLSSQTEY